MRPPLPSAAEIWARTSGAVDAAMAAVHHDLGQRDRYGFPDPGLAPAPDPPADRVPVAIFGRHIAPSRAVAKPPKYAVDDRTVLFGRTSTPPVRRVNWQQSREKTPLGFTQIAPAQARHERKALDRPPGLASTNLSTRPSITVAFLISYERVVRWPDGLFANRTRR
jgi:hypothetical protein